MQPVGRGEHGRTGADYARRAIPARADADPARRQQARGAELPVDAVEGVLACDEDRRRFVEGEAGAIGVVHQANPAATQVEEQLRTPVDGCACLGNSLLRTRARSGPLRGRMLRRSAERRGAKGAAVVHLDRGFAGAFLTLPGHVGRRTRRSDRTSWETGRPTVAHRSAVASEAGIIPGGLAALSKCSRPCADPGPQIGTGAIEKGAAAPGSVSSRCGGIDKWRISERSLGFLRTH